MNNKIYYQPNNLSDIFGQFEAKGVIKKILTGAYLPSALLFDGPPGVGKTALSSVLSLGLNCKNYDSENFKICRICRSCLNTNYFKDVYRASMLSLTERNITGLKSAISFSPLHNIRIISIEEVQNWSFKDQDRFLTILDAQATKSLLILNSTVDRNNENRKKERFLEAFEGRCLPVYFNYLGEKSLRLLLLAVAKRNGIQLQDSQIREIINRSNGSGRIAVQQFSYVLAKERASKKVDSDQRFERIYR